MQSYNAKLKTIFILGLSALVLSGCAKNTNLNELQKNIPEQAVFVRAPAVQTKKQIKILFVGDMMFDRYIREGVSKYGNGD
ncbi:MAG: hypothetical protein NT093_02655, partial [Candidatus Moranbacteria bacterium]|nr:hypothetical protein [Candidatus Moranbacteria bacterium]